MQLQGATHASRAGRQVYEITRYVCHTLLEEVITENCLWKCMPSCTKWGGSVPTSYDTLEVLVLNNN